MTRMIRKPRFPGSPFLRAPAAFAAVALVSCNHDALDGGAADMAVCSNTPKATPSCSSATDLDRLDQTNSNDPSKKKTVGSYSFYLVGAIAATNTEPNFALLVVEDKDCNVLDKFKIAEGRSTLIIIEGVTWLAEVGEVAAGGSPESTWAAKVKLSRLCSDGGVDMGAPVDLLPFMDLAPLPFPRDGGLKCPNPVQCSKPIDIGRLDQGAGYVVDDTIFRYADKDAQTGSAVFDAVTCDGLTLNASIVVPAHSSKTIVVNGVRYLFEVGDVILGGTFGSKYAVVKITKLCPDAGVPDAGVKG